MPSFREQIHIDAPKDQVWATLADIGSIYKWNPGVTKSYAVRRHPRRGRDQALRSRGRQQLS